MTTIDTNVILRYLLNNELAHFVPIIKAAVGEGKKVQVYFNNHPNGSGAKNGIRLKEMIVMEKIGMGKNHLENSAP